MPTTPTILHQSSTKFLKPSCCSHMFSNLKGIGPLQTPHLPLTKLDNNQKLALAGQSRLHLQKQVVPIVWNLKPIKPGSPLFIWSPSPGVTTSSKWEIVKFKLVINLRESSHRLLQPPHPISLLWEPGHIEITSYAPQKIPKPSQSTQLLPEIPPTVNGGRPIKPKEGPNRVVLNPTKFMREGEPAFLHILQSQKS